MSLRDEMLIELRLQPRARGGSVEIVWLVGTASVATIVALSRWRDANALVSVTMGHRGYVLQTDEVRVNVCASAEPGVNA